MLSKLKKINFETLLYGSWLISLSGVAMSLIYSEVLKIAICPLCWYQRIFWYPLIIIYFVGIVTKDKNSFKYALPLIIFGFSVALFQVMMQAGILPEALEKCTFSLSSVYVSCKKVDFRLFGLITIPQQALAGFLTLGLLNVWGVLAGKVK